MQNFRYRDTVWAGAPAIQLQGVQNGKPYGWLQRIYDGDRDDAIRAAIEAAEADGAEPCEVADADWLNPNAEKRAVWTHTSKAVQLQANPKDSVARFVLKKGHGSAALSLDADECRALAASLIEVADLIDKP